MSDFTSNPIFNVWGSGYEYSAATPGEFYGRLEASCSLLGSGLAHGEALQTTVFRVLGCQEYQLTDSTSAGTGGEGFLRLSLQPTNGFAPILIDLGNDLNVSMAGRLPPGDYELTASTVTGEHTTSVQAPSIFYTIFFADCPSSLIAFQPVSVIASPGEEAQFSVGASGSAAPGSVTYQWQKDLMDLADGGPISGVTTSALTISNVQPEDAGVYNVILDDGTVSESSSYVTLTLDNATAVPVDGMQNSGFALAAPYPNPFSSGTAIRYSLAAESPVRLEIFDVRGRRVRMLVDELRLAAGNHETRWNRDDESGARSAAGVYFVRMEAGGHQTAVRVVYRPSGSR